MSHILHASACSGLPHNVLDSAGYSTELTAEFRICLVQHYTHESLSAQVGHHSPLTIGILAGIKGMYTLLTKVIPMLLLIIIAQFCQNN